MANFDGSSSSDEDNLLFADAQEGDDELFQNAAGLAIATSTAIAVDDDALARNSINNINHSMIDLSGDDTARFPSTSLTSLFSPLKSNPEISGFESAINLKAAVPSTTLTSDQIDINQKAFAYLQELYRDRQGGQSGLTRIDEEELHHTSTPSDGLVKVITSKSENGRSESGNSSSGGNSVGKTAASTYGFVQKMAFRNPFKKRAAVGGDSGNSKNTALNDPLAVKITSARGRGFEEPNHIGFKLSQSFEGHQGACWCIKLSPNGKYLASCGQDSVIYVWASCDPTISALLSRSLGDKKDNGGDRRSPSIGVENDAPQNRIKKLNTLGR